ncbi:MAG: trypsin-like peptidase domain-containing protein [Planctomycetes bacterium]|nr:trypsin-like peptidase domain-containing protein [Planctomycetota bacterium]
MHTRLPRGLFLCSLALLNGCSALNNFEDALEEAGWAQFDRSDRRANQVGRVSLLAIRADGSWTRGAGAAVGPGRVLTVAHVLEGAVTIEAEVNGRLIAVSAHVQRRIHSEPEDLIELCLDRSDGFFGFSGFTPDEILEVGYGEPTQLWASNGLFHMPCESRPGDSGSPLLDERGRLVGLLIGTLGGSPVWASLPAEEELERDSHTIHAAAFGIGDSLWESPRRVRSAEAVRPSARPSESIRRI